MKVSQIILVLLAARTAVGCSSRSAAEQPTLDTIHFEADSSLHVVTKEPSGILLNENAYPFYGVGEGDEIPIKYHCDNLYPGLDHLVHGTRHDFFDDDPSVEPKPLSPFLTITCSNPSRTKQTRGFSSGLYVLPDQAQDVVYLPRQILTDTFQSVVDVEESIRFVKSEVAGFWMNLLAWFRGFKSPMVRHITHVVNVKCETHVAYLQPNAKNYLTSSFKKAYFDLPTSYKNAEMMYKNFLDFYGSGYYKSSKFGGQLSIILALSRQVSKDDILKYPFVSNISIGEIIDGVRDTFPNDYIKSKVFSLGGSWLLSNTISDWIQKVEVNPIVVSGDRRMFPTLFEDDSRMQPFTDALETEDRRLSLRRMRVIVKNLKDDPFASNIGTLIDDEIKLVVPRKSVVDILQTSVLSDPALSRLQFSFMCAQFGRKIHPFKINFTAVGFLCSNLVGEARHCAAESTWSLNRTNKQLCLRIYSNNYCVGHFVTVKSEIEMPTLNSIRSFMACTE